MRKCIHVKNFLYNCFELVSVKHEKSEQGKSLTSFILSPTLRDKSWEWISWKKLSKIFSILYFRPIIVIFMLCIILFILFLLDISDRALCCIAVRGSEFLGSHDRVSKRLKFVFTVNLNLMFIVLLSKRRFFVMHLFHFFLILLASSKITIYKNCIISLKLTKIDNWVR